MLPELRARALYLTAREIGERVPPRTPLNVREGATLESANNWDTNRGNFQESALDYYSVFSQSNDSNIRVKALVGLSQELINLGSFWQARREFLPLMSSLIPHLSELKQYYYGAVREEKLGWIEDYEWGYTQELKSLGRARRSLRKIPHANWGEEERKLEGTLDHFSGRAYFGLAAQGIRKLESLNSAVQYFELDLRRARGLRQEGTPNPANECFQHLRLVACYILFRDLQIARNYLNQAKVLAQEEKEKTGRQGLIAHCHLVEGRILIEEEELAGARREFNTAIEIRRNIEPYPKGLSDALIGIAYTYLKEGKLVEAGRNFKEAIKVYPVNLGRIAAIGFF